MNVLIPMAGENKSFIENKYPFPKYLAEIKNKTLIELVINNLNIEANYIFVVKKEEYEKYNLKFLLDLLTDKNEIIILNKKTNGALDTVLEAREFINNDNPLIIANCDQLLDWNSNQFLYSSIGDSVEGSIVTFKSTLPKYSYIRLDDNGFVNEVKEKQVISNIATAGIYYYSSGKRFVD
jgi:NDP-sugar pyrophosphorylase family protein